MALVSSHLLLPPPPPPPPLMQAELRLFSKLHHSTCL